MRSIGTLAGEIIERIEQERRQSAKIIALDAKEADDCPGEEAGQPSFPGEGEGGAPGMGKVIVMEEWRRHRRLRGQSTARSAATRHTAHPRAMTDT